MPDENNPVTWNSLLSGHIRCGDLDGAVRIFDGMPVRNVVSWTTMLTGCARNGWFRHALSLFQEMRRAGLELDQASLTVALSVCAELGDLSTGKWIHSYVNKAFDGRGTRQLCEVKPDARTFFGVLLACSQEGYVGEGRAGFLEEAQRLVETMPMKANDIVWGALLCGCIIHRNLDIASCAGNAAQKLIMKPDLEKIEGSLVSMSNNYATARRWGEVAITWKNMIETGSKNDNSRSLMQINEVIHELMAGDIIHLHTTSIYEMNSLASSVPYLIMIDWDNINPKSESAIAAPYKMLIRGIQ
uniref:Pentatricopeptide repeat-containing protein n=1 Tax=Chenopodium quinoa TaxID=63459 RepID=A0A803M111_CHEQI